MRNLRLAERLLNRPLMITEGKLNVILHVLGPRLNLDLSAMPKTEAATLSEQDRARAGYRVQDGCGIIGIHGPLMHRVLAAEFPSGGPTSYADIRKSFDTALADDGVRSIILDIDSPGGEVNGAFDLADHIFQARGIKPITAVVNESAYSAAYLLASAASRIVLPRTGGVGSVGVIATHADLSRAEDAAGLTVTHVFAGARKADFSPHQPLSSEALQTLQEMVDDSYSLFIETVARNRGMSVKAVRDTEAGIFEGKKAVAAKLADEVAPADKAVATAGKSRKTMITATPAGKENRTMNIEELRENHPDLVGQIETAARQGMVTQSDAAAAVTTAVAAECGRVCALVGACFGEEPAQKFAAIAGKGLSAEDITALGITVVPEATSSADEASRGAILKGLHIVAPEGLKGSQLVAGEAAERSAAASAIAAGGSSRR